MDTELAQLLRRAEGTADINPLSSYKLVTLRLHHKGVQIREEKQGYAIRSKCYVARPGQFIVSRIDARNGAMGLVPDSLDGAIVTGDFLLYEMDKGKVDPSYFDLYTMTASFVRKCRLASEGTTNRVRLRPSKFLAIRISIPPLAAQRNTIRRLERIRNRLNEVRSNANEILGDLDLARKSILNEAYRGDLTIRDPADEPANVLLKRLEESRENEQNVKPGAKIRPHNAVKGLDEPNSASPLPASWAWSHLDELCQYVVDCPHSTPRFEETGIFCIDTTCLRPGAIIVEQARRVGKTTYEERIRRLRPSSGDIIFGREGTIGNAAVIPKGLDACLGQRVLLLRPWPMIDPAFLMWALNSPLIGAQIKPLILATAAPHLNVKDIRKLMIPVAPLREQKRVVNRISTLLGQVNELESLVTGFSRTCSLMERSAIDFAVKSNRTQNTNETPESAS